MLTPSFDLTQESDYIVINIRAPYTKVSDTEIFFDGTEFRFFSKPYFLRLNLPGNVIEDGRESAKYDSDKGSYIVRVPKENAGEHFEGLDMLTALLAPKKDNFTSPKIEVLDSKDNVENECDSENDEDFDWHVQQTVLDEGTLISTAKYGFGGLKSGVFKKLGEEITREVVDLPNPESVSVNNRNILCTENETNCFNEDHYLGDLFDDDIINTLIEFETQWHEAHQSIVKNGSSSTTFDFTEEEKDKMLKLPRKEYILSEQESFPVFLGLVDLMLAHAYNHRITEGENTVESPWNIRKLSPTLSWLAVHTSLRDVVIAFYKRVLCFPLYRHFLLASQVFKDVQEVFRIGQKQILKNLLEIHSLFNGCDPCYVLNELYITDYCVWIQTIKPDTIKTLSDSLSTVEVTKADIGFDLVRLEATALQSSEDADIKSATNQMSTLGVGSHDQRNLDSDDETDSDEDSDTDSETDETEGESESEENDSDVDVKSKDETGLTIDKTDCNLGKRSLVTVISEESVPGS